MSILNEVEYQFRTPLGSAIRPYVGQGLFIHFGQTPKMGVNVNKFHMDPAAVYFYSLDWLNQHPRFTQGEQFATNWPYWTIVRLADPSAGIVLSRVTYEDIEALAERNHFTALWDEFRASNSPPSQHPAATMLWSFVRMMGRKGSLDPQRMSPNAVLRGVPFVHDDGLGLIHGSEPNQLLVMNPRAIQIVESGNQSLKRKNRGASKLPGSKLPDDAETSDHKYLKDHRHAFVELLKRFRGQYGGELRWLHHIPTLTFEVRGATFKMTWRAGSWDSKLVMDVAWGRAKKSFTFDEGKFARLPMDEVVKFFTDIVVRISALAAKGKDLFFTPILSEDAARKAMLGLIDPAGFGVETEINNEHQEMTITATKAVDVKNMKVLSIAYTINGDDKVRYSALVKINHNVIASARVSEDRIDDLPEAICATFEDTTSYLAPNNTDGYPRRFYYEDDFKAFKGFVADISGIRALQERYSDEIQFWRDYPNKEHVYSEIKRHY